MKRYVIGFFIDTAKDAVLLIERRKPDWQQGLVNGIGGKIEPGEDVQVAMAREFFEEAGVETSPYDWRHFVTVTHPGKGWELNVLTTSGVLGEFRTQCEEGAIALYPTLPPNMERTAHWLCLMAMDESVQGAELRGQL